MPAQEAGDRNGGIGEGEDQGAGERGSGRKRPPSQLAPADFPGEDMLYLNQRDFIEWRHVKITTRGPVVRVSCNTSPCRIRGAADEPRGRGLARAPIPY